MPPWSPARTPATSVLLTWYPLCPAECGAHTGCSINAGNKQMALSSRPALWIHLSFNIQIAWLPAQAGDFSPSESSCWESLNSTQVSSHVAPSIPCLTSAQTWHAGVLCLSLSQVPPGRDTCAYPESAEGSEKWTWRRVVLPERGKSGTSVLHSFYLSGASMESSTDRPSTQPHPPLASSCPGHPRSSSSAPLTPPRWLIGLQPHKPLAQVSFQLFLKSPQAGLCVSQTHSSALLNNPPFPLAARSPGRDPETSLLPGPGFSAWRLWTGGLHCRDALSPRKKWLQMASGGSWQPWCRRCASNLHNSHLTAVLGFLPF